MIEMKAIIQTNDALNQIKAVRKEWFGELQHEVREIKALYERTTATWEHDVSFLTKVKVSEREQYGEVWAENRIYWFVHESISVMRVVLSPDWSPKTQPRVLGSGAGSGRKMYASMNIAKPPYEARKFTDEIVKERKDEYQANMQRATERGAKAAP